MKRRIAYFVLTLFLFFSASMPVFAVETGLLYGKALNIGSNLDITASTNLAMTDNDTSTYYTMTSSSVWYKFAEPTDISEIYVDATLSYRIKMIVYDANKVSLGTIAELPLGNYAFSINDVSYIRLVDNSGLAGSQIKEFEVYGVGEPSIPVPSQVTDLQSSGITSNSLDLTWTSLGSGVTYEIYRGESVDSYILQTTLPENTVNYHDTGLLSATTYYYKIVPVNVTGSGPSTEISVTTNTITVPLPTIPTGLTVDGNSPTGDKVFLTWTANPLEENVTSYKVYVNGEFYSTVTEPTATVSGLTKGATYSFTVSAVNEGGETVPSVSVDGVPVIKSTETETFNPDSLDLGIKMGDIFAGIGLFLLQIWPLIALGIAVPLAFKLSGKTGNLGKDIEKSEVRKGHKKTGYFGNKAPHSKKGVLLARRSTRKIRGGRRLTRRGMKYGVKRVTTAKQKKRRTQQKYGTHKLGYLSKNRSNKRSTSQRKSTPRTSTRSYKPRQRRK